jgi:uncharacterized protein (DUF305 family)
MLTDHEEPAVPAPKSDWIAAAQLGLVSSTFSTGVSQLFAGRIGRDAAVDWMTVAGIPARDWAISTDPSWWEILSGIAFHQWADFSWALVFFGLLGRWTASLAPMTILALAIPWAVFSSATEWLVLVPLLPFWQPMFTLQQPYWIGLLVHLSSAFMYPLFVLLRWPIGRAPPSRDVALGKIWGGFGIVVVVGLAVMAALSELGHELPWRGFDLHSDQTYIRHMTTHHEQGIQLAELGAARASDPHLRALARLMIASQTGENRIFEAWWRSWFAEPMALCTTEERAAMPGFLTVEQMEAVKSTASGQFDAMFVRAMSIHHAGAVKMADQEWHSDGDPRLRIMAHAIRHEQQGEIALMRGVNGLEAVSLAIRNMMADNVN